MNIENVTVFGAGRIGGQIAFHAAFHGYKVVVFDVDQEAVNQAIERIRTMAARYMQDTGAQELEFDKAFGNLSYSFTMSDAARDADIIIEAIPNGFAIKKNFYQQLARIAPQRTLFAASSSATPAAELAGISGRPEQFLGFGLFLDIWKEKKIKITLFKETDVETFYSAAAFAEDLELVVLPVNFAE